MASLTLIDPAPWVGGNPEAHELLTKHLSLKSGKRRSLAARLSAFGVQVFTNESILRLKQEKCDAAERRNRKISWKKRFWEKREFLCDVETEDLLGRFIFFEFVCKLLPLATVGGAVLNFLGCSSMLVTNIGPFLVSALLGYLVIYPSYRFGYFSTSKQFRLREIELEIRRQHAIVEWVSASLKDYLQAGGEVPVPVLALAEEILENCDQHERISFHVEYTVDVDVQTAFDRRREEQQQRQRRADARAIALLNDPILWVAEDGEEYAIAVWDEEGMDNLVLGTPKSANA